MKQWRIFLTAVAFLTRVPVYRFAGDHDPDVLRRSVFYFPLVGLFVGIFTAGVISIGGLLWHPVLAVLVALACEALLTGAFHEDAVADFFDAFGGGWTRDDVLRILKDSRIGAYGSLALLLAVALRATSLALLVTERSAAPEIWIAVLVASTTFGRWIILLAMALVPPVERESLSRDVGARVSMWTVLLSGLYVGPVSFAFVWYMPLRALLAAVFIAGAFTWLITLIRRKLGGITGDCLGCICYITQVLILLAAC